MYITWKRRYIFADTVYALSLWVSFVRETISLLILPVIDI